MYTSQSVKTNSKNYIFSCQFCLPPVPEEEEEKERRGKGREVERKRKREIDSDSVGKTQCRDSVLQRNASLSFRAALRSSTTYEIRSF